MATQLHQILAVSSDRSSAAQAILQETIKTFSGKPDHFIERHSVYKPLEDGEADSEELFKAMVDTVDSKLKHCLGIVGKSWDVEVTKDRTNQLTSAPIVVNGKQITGPIPATSLLLLESKVKAVIEMFQAIPTLAPGRKWELAADKGDHIYRDCNPDERWRTKKTVVSKILAPATDKHPAQIDKWNEDVNVGKTVTHVWCSMLSPAEKSELLSKATELLIAIKSARQVANSQEVEQVAVADSIIAYLLS
jgi:hypothetical protein